MSAGTTVCPSCGVQRRDDDDPCPECGTVPATEDGIGAKYGGTGPAKGTNPRGTGKNTMVAAALSLLLPGFGHIYLARIGRGMAWFIGGLGVGGFATSTAPSLAVFAFLLPFAAAIDAWRVAS